MQCKACNYPDSRVVETTQNERMNQVIRRRECVKCGTRFTTQEQLRDPSRPKYRTVSPLPARGNK